MKNLSILIICLFVGSSCKDFGAKPVYKKGFIKFFGGASEDVSSELEITPEGGYVVIGTSASFGNATDMYVFKADDEGNLLWQNNFGGSRSDSGKSIKKTPDGYIAVGTFSDSIQKYMYAVKVNEQGQPQWEQKYKANLPNRKDAVGKSISETSYSPGYVLFGDVVNTLAGVTEILPIIIGVDGVLNPVQFKTFGFDNTKTLGIKAFESVVSNERTFFWLGNVLPNNGSGNIPTTPVFGNLRNNGISVPAYLKTEAIINLPDIVNGTDMKKTTDGGYIVTGTCINNGNSDAYILKLDANLGKVKYKFFGGGKNETSSSVFQTKDGGFILTGSTESKGNGGKDIYILKVSSDLEFEWDKTYGGPSDDYGTCIKQTGDNGYIISGVFTLITSPSDNKVICLIKTDQGGEIMNK